MASKIEEKKILYRAFKKDLIEKDLIEDEIPDFILVNSEENFRVGVEITTVYADQASAIRRDENFSDKLIDEHIKGRKRKKVPHFLEVLKVSKVHGGEDLIHKGHIVWQILKLENYFSFLEKIIDKKSKAYVSKVKDLEYVLLVAQDMDDYFKPFNTKPGELYELIRSHTLFQSILKSTFQEIFLISEFKGGTYKIGLKDLIFQSEYAIFDKFWLKINGRTPFNTMNIKMKMENFVISLWFMGYHNIYLHSDENYYYVMHGIVTWKFNKTNASITKNDFFWTELPDENKVENILKDVGKYETFFKQYIEFRKNVSVQIKEDLFIKIK